MSKLLDLLELFLCPTHTQSDYERACIHIPPRLPFSPARLYHSKHPYRCQSKCYRKTCVADLPIDVGLAGCRTSSVYQYTLDISGICHTHEQFGRLLDHLLQSVVIVDFV